MSKELAAAQTASLTPSQATSIPNSFIEFCKLIKFELSPGQRVLSLVCFDGLNPCDLEGEEAAWLLLLLAAWL